MGSVLSFEQAGSYEPANKRKNENKTYNDHCADRWFVSPQHVR